MWSCKVVDFLFAAVPMTRWQDFLIRVHRERCPVCRARLAAREEARSVLYREEDFGARSDMWGRIRAAATLPSPTPRPAAWPRPGLARFATAAVVLALAAGVSALVLVGFRVERPSGPRPEAARFTLEYVRVDREPADPFIYQARDQRLTLVWAAKKSKGGLT